MRAVVDESTKYLVLTDNVAFADINVYGAYPEDAGVAHVAFPAPSVVNI